VAVAGDQPDLVMVFSDQQPVAVLLDLVNLVGPIRDFL
jgi:hypothetical protein